MLGFDLSRMNDAISRTPLFRGGGKLLSAKGMLTSRLPSAAVGDQCAIISGRSGTAPVLAEVIGFDNDLAYLMPYDPADYLHPGMTVMPTGQGIQVPTGRGLLGRMLDGLGRPIDKYGPLRHCPLKPMNRPAPSALERQRIREPFVTGVRAIDGILTCGKGQRIAIMAGSGVGKSTLLGEIAKGSEADVNVIALIGERGRELMPFVEDVLGEEGMARSVLIVATCEQTPLMRVRATQAATAIADYFRADGLNVLVMMDSLTRLAMAQRELGLMLGEPPTSRGYTPSVFRELANTVERLGNDSTGTMTALLTVLVDGGDMDEPIADAVRGVVDGHIVLNRKIAQDGIYPAIDIPASISRVASDVTDKEHLIAARKLRSIMTTYNEISDMVRIGMYQRGTSEQADLALELMPKVKDFLCQERGERSTLADTRAKLFKLTEKWKM